MDTPGAARRLQRRAAAHHRVLDALGADERLYAKYKAIAPSLSAEQRQYDQRVAATSGSGAELQGAAKERWLPSRNAWPN